MSDSMDDWEFNIEDEAQRVHRLALSSAVSRYLDVWLSARQLDSRPEELNEALRGVLADLDVVKLKFPAEDQDE